MHEFCASLFPQRGTMLRSELETKLLDEFPHLRREEAQAVVETILGGISDALAKGDRVELRGFGAFSIRKRKARPARNPKTGDPVQVEAKRSAYFKPGSELRARINDGVDPEAR